MCAVDTRALSQRCPQTHRGTYAPWHIHAKGGPKLSLLLMGPASPRLHVHARGLDVHPAASTNWRIPTVVSCASKAKGSVISESGAGDTETSSPGQWPAHLMSTAACVAMLTCSVGRTSAATLQSSSLTSTSLESQGSAHSMHSTPHVLMHLSAAPNLISLEGQQAAPAHSLTVSTDFNHSEAMDMSNFRTADLQLSLDGWLPILPSTPTTLAAQAPSTSHRQQNGWWLLGHSPMLVLDKKHPVWWNLAVLIAANILGIQLVLALLKRLGDRSEPVTLLRLQLGLVHPPGGPGAKALVHLRERLAKLNSMMQVVTRIPVAQGHVP